MSWIKKVFTDFQTVIDAAFLNGIQDQVIADETDLANKVDKVTGKGLSTQDFTTALKNKLQALPMAETLDTELDGKVDKVEGKGLSTNDYTNAEKQRVADSALQTDLDALDDRVDQIYNGGVLYDTASGSIASFSDGADNMPVKKLVAQIEPVQAGSGDPSPDNVRPISGRTGLSCVRTGKNVFPFNLSVLKSENIDGIWTGNTYSCQGLIYTVEADDDGNVTKIDVSGTLTAADHFLYLGGRYPSIRTHLMKSGQYIATGYSAPYKLRVGKGVENTFVGNFDAGSTIELNGDVFEFGLRIQNASGQSVNTILYPMLRLATDTDSTYEPSYSDTVSVNWQDTAGTVYGSTLTLNPDRTGTLVVDRDITDLGSLSWGDQSVDSKHLYRAIISDRALGSWNSGYKCSHYLVYGIGSTTELKNNMPDNSFGYQGTTKHVWIRDDSIVSVSDAASALAGVMLTYPLETPQTIQLTAEQVSGILTTLYGTNNIWADTGDVTVEYPADTKLFIEKLTQPTEDDMTADHAISAGTFFQLGNTLYLATAQIAAGATITPGTNATKLSIADALNTLNS